MLTYAFCTEVFCEKTCDPGSEGEAEQKTEGRPDQIGKTAACSKDRNTDETEDQVYANT